MQTDLNEYETKALLTNGIGMVNKVRMKQTEIGLIPEDWELLWFKDIVNRNGGIKIGPFGSQLKKELLVENGYKVYGQENIYDNNFEIGNRYLDTTHFYSLKSCEVLPNDFLISMMGTIGKCAIAPKTIKRGIIDSHLIRIRLDFRKVLNEYLLHVFKSKLVLYQIKMLSVGGIMDGLSSKIIKSLLIPLPPFAEQETISTVLCDCDAWITSIEQVLAKKRLIKQGAMQELLTPKDDWEAKRLGDIADIVGGGTPSTFVSAYWNGNVEWFTPTEVGYNKYLYSSKRKISELGLKNSSANILPINSILLTSRAGIGDLGILKVEASTNQGFQSIICRENIDVEFIYYLMSTKKEHLVKNASGSTFLEINPNRVKSLEIHIPSLQEQMRIATILSDMDLEIEAIEQKLNRARQIKQGMMQELLTGRVRLV